MKKFFRVAKSGRTADGRNITAEQINQMAANYSPEKYGARIWLEHFRGLFPDSIFKSLGDVTEARATDADDGERYLELALHPTSELIEMNQNRQKVFTSIEMNPNFADTNEAYLTGLAVTDSPASLGTEMLAFSQKNTPDNLLSDYLEHDVSAFNLNELEEQDAPEEHFGDKLLAKVKSLFSARAEKDTANQEEIGQAVVEVAEFAKSAADQVESLKQQLETQSQNHAAETKALEDKLQAFEDKFSALENTPTNIPRSPSAGGETVKTDC